MNKFIYILCTNILLFQGCQDNMYLNVPKSQNEIPFEFKNEQAFFEETYKIKSNDKLSISIYKAGMAKDGIAEPSNGVNPSISVFIKDDGTINLPLIGQINALNKDIKTIENEILEKLKIYYKNPIVQVELIDTEIYVLGEVKKPGVIKMRSNKMNLLEVISNVGDFTVDSDKKNVSIIRDFNTAPKITFIDMTQLNLYYNKELVLNPNDIVYIASSSKKIFNDKMLDTFPFLDMINKMFNAAVSRKTLVE